jgi:hypothetical protein
MGRACVLLVCACASRTLPARQPDDLRGYATCLLSCVCAACCSLITPGTEAAAKASAAAKAKAEADAKAAAAAKAEAEVGGQLTLLMKAPGCQNMFFSPCL